MIYEKLYLNLDVKKLRSYLETVVLKLPWVEASPGWGGWSVTSSTGRYTDGWDWYQDPAKRFDVRKLWRYAWFQVLAFKPENARKPTEIYTGYIIDVMKSIEELGLQPTRARVVLLKARSKTSFHVDGDPSKYRVRLHIPIITNPHCVFVCDSGRAHLPDDGNAYFVKINRMHGAINSGETDRYHLFMDIVDKNKISKWHQFNGEAVKV